MDITPIYSSGLEKPKLPTLPKPLGQSSNQSTNITTTSKKIKASNNRSKSSKIYPGLIASQATCNAPVSWKDIYGLQEVKTEFQEVIQYLKSGLWPMYNILLYGLPGCGKTKLSQAFANECGMQFSCMKAKDIIQTYYTSLAYLCERFNLLKRSAPCVLFLDELDVLSGSPDASNYVGMELDKLKSEQIFIIAALERLDQLPTILLPPRLYRTICVPLPDEASRKQIFLANIVHYELDPNTIDPNGVARLTERFSGLDVINMCYNASKICQRQFRSQVRKSKQVANQQQPMGASVFTNQFPNPTNKINSAHIHKAIQNGQKSLKVSEILEFEIVSHIFRKLREFLMDLKTLTLYKKLDKNSISVIEKKQNELIDMLKTIQQKQGSTHKTENIQILINENFQAERNSAFQLEKLLKQILLENKNYRITEENKQKLLKKKPSDFLKEIERLKRRETSVIEEIIL